MKRVLGLAMLDSPQDDPFTMILQAFYLASEAENLIGVLLIAHM